MKTPGVAALGIVVTTAFGVTAEAQSPGKNPQGVNPAHYQCYKIPDAQQFKEQSVRLRDQFQVSEAKVLKPVLLCAPVSKNGQAVRDPRTHLLCYEEEGGKPVDKKAVIANQFGNLEVAIGAPALLCVPSLKRLK
jgi:hypothetical protein